METINGSLKILINLSKIHALISRRFDRLTVHGISFNDFVILYLLRQSAGQKMRRIDLANMLGVTASAVTRMLLPMEKIGLVSREGNERDARVRYVMLSNTGSQLLEDAQKTANEVAAEILPDERLDDLTPVTKLFSFLGGDIK